MLLLFCLAVLGFTSAVEFQCDGPPENTTLAGGHVLHVAVGHEFYEPGTPFTVTIQSVNTDFQIRHFSIQARDPAQGSVWGTWDITALTASKVCIPGDMLYSVETINEISFDNVWNVPSTEYPSAVEFHVKVMFDDELYHTYITPIVREKSFYDPHNSPSELDEAPLDPAMNEEPAAAIPESEMSTPAGDVEDPNGGETLYGDMAHHADELDHLGDEPSTTTAASTLDLHDPAPEIAQSRDAAAQRYQQIADEDANSEGDWSMREAEEERRREEEYDWELREQERIKYEQDKKREDIILWEIRDKEEHDAMLARQTPAPPINDIDIEQSGEIDLLEDGNTGAGAGGAALTFSILTVVSAILFHVI